MAGVFAESALAAIEFHDALEQVAQHAVTPLGHARVCALRPTADREWIRSELTRVGAVAAMLAEHEDAEPVGFPDAARPLERLGIEGSVLDGTELVVLAQLLAAARLAGGKLRRMAKAHACLAPVAAAPLPPELEAELLKALDPDGRVRDEASRDLARIRRELVETREQIVSALERILAGLDARQRGGEAGVTMRNGRYVIPLRPGARQRTGGIVHDESATHATIFVEPPETIELGNRLRAVEAEEAREVQRILRALTAALRPHTDGLAAAFEMLIVFDALYARARHMNAVGAELPALGEAGTEPLALREAAHPLLFATGASVVRFDLVLEGAERTVLVSGPNTGGKTVLIKAVGLASALTQAGVPAPLGPGSRVPVFARCYADIGDRQSIAESLSTFSAHVAAMKEVLEGAGPDTLVLLDELGTGTDPAEGAALAAAFLRWLTARGATSVATTHLGALKELAATTPGIVNASLAFDAAGLTPTYRFAKGVPGRSYGLAIARRLGIAPAILAEAEQRLPADERRLDATLAAAEARTQALDRRAAELEELAARLEREQAVLAAARTAAEGHEDAVRRREKELERAAKRGLRDVLLEARAEVEKAVALAREGKEREARRALEERIAELADGPVTDGPATDGPMTDGPTDRRTEFPAPLPSPLVPGFGAWAYGGGGGGYTGSGTDEAGTVEPPLAPAPRSLTPGLKVRIRSLGVEGEVETVRGPDVAVLVRGRRVRVKVSDLAAASATPDPRPPAPR